MNKQATKKHHKTSATEEGLEGEQTENEHGKHGEEEDVEEVAAREGAARELIITYSNTYMHSVNLLESSCKTIIAVYTIKND